jgi:hypothetical protein
MFRVKITSKQRWQQQQQRQRQRQQLEPKRQRLVQQRELVLVQERVLQQLVLVQELVLLFYRKQREQQQPSELRVRKTCSFRNSLGGETISGNCQHKRYVCATE